MWKLHVRTFEEQDRAKNKWRPVLEHTFFGSTKEEALHYSESHAKTDSFYRAIGGHVAAQGAYDGHDPAIVRANFKGIRTFSEATLRSTRR